MSDTGFYFYNLLPWIVRLNDQIAAGSDTNTTLQGIFSILDLQADWADEEVLGIYNLMNAEVCDAEFLLYLSATLGTAVTTDISPIFRRWFVRNLVKFHKIKGTHMSWDKQWLWLTENAYGATELWKGQIHEVGDYEQSEDPNHQLNSARFDVYSSDGSTYLVPSEAQLYVNKIDDLRPVHVLLRYWYLAGGIDDYFAPVLEEPIFNAQANFEDSAQNLSDYVTTRVVCIGSSVVCQSGCESLCEDWCQTGCETICEHFCEIDSCQIRCMFSSEGNQQCQTTCMILTEPACQTSCVFSAVMNQICYASCQLAIQPWCHTSCVGALEPFCQTSCTVCNCESYAFCQTSCIGLTQAACQTMNMMSVGPYPRPPWWPPANESIPDWLWNRPGGDPCLTSQTLTIRPPWFPPPGDPCFTSQTFPPLPPTSPCPTHCEFVFEGGGVIWSPTGRFYCYNDPFGDSPTPVPHIFGGDGYIEMRYNGILKGLSVTTNFTNHFSPKLISVSFSANKEGTTLTGAPTTGDISVPLSGIYHAINNSDGTAVVSKGDLIGLSASCRYEGGGAGSVWGNVDVTFDIEVTS